MTRRASWLAAVGALALIVAACTGADSDGATSGSTPSARPVDTATTSTSEPASPPPATPQQAALDAYERYTAATAESMADGQSDRRELTAVAVDQALTHIRRRLRVNRNDGVVVTGALTPSATADDVELGDAGATATVSDCVLNDLAHVDAADPGNVVTAATGWRQPVTATVEQRDSRWIVTGIKVPLRDGSGSVPPPPDDPPYLRGPAQGPAPPSCVPPDLAEGAVAAYGAFRDAYDKALGLGRAGPADPDLPALSETAVDPQLSAAREFASELANNGQAFRGEPDSHDPWAVASTESDQTIVVYDCVVVGQLGEANESSTKPPSTNPNAGSRRLEAADLVRINGVWRVSGVSVIEEGLEECTSSVQQEL